MHFGLCSIAEGYLIEERLCFLLGKENSRFSRKGFNLKRSGIRIDACQSDLPTEASFHSKNQSISLHQWGIPNIFSSHSDVGGSKMYWDFTCHHSCGNFAQRCEECNKMITWRCSSVV
uniref:GSKIP domain-containing protein n=1 Tax=Parascaris univalens TaxID=6257 RepID=A0A914ZGS2_PARUN